MIRKYDDGTGKLTAEILDAEDTAKIPAEILDVLADDSFIMPQTTTKMAMLKYTRIYDTAKIPSELLDSLNTDKPLPVTPLTHKPHPSESVRARLAFLDALPFDEGDTAKSRTINA